MVHITKPIMKVEDVFSACISNYKDESYKSKLEGVTDYIVSNTNTYNRLAASNNISSISTSTTVDGSITVNEMKKVYERKLACKGQPGRRYYEELKLQALHNICPLCNQRTVSTLDHVLAKKDYPTFAVSPVNLIPACADCNKIKSTYSPSSPEEEIMHPYYDDISSKQYLYASVNEDTPPSVTFYIKSSNLETIIEKRLKKHFTLFALNELYIANSAKALSGMHFRLSKLNTSGGSSSIKEHLKEEFYSRYNDNKNSWETALYEALYKSDWFCNGGFKY